MEGKACLFKKFAGIDVFDIELAETDPGGARQDDRPARADLRRHQPRGHQGARLLLRRAQAARADEDPGLPRRPARHRDRRRRGDPQRAQGASARTSRNVKLVCSGAGAAAIACLDLLVGVGLKRENVVVCDSKGVIYTGRETPMEENKARYARRHDGAHAGRRHRRRGHLPRALGSEGADAGHGRRRWRAQPLILALANPEPEILPELAKAVRPDAHHRDRPLGLPEPGEQRAVLPVHLPRRARRGRDLDHRGDEARLHARDRRARARRAVGHRRPGLRRRGPRVRPRIPDPEALRSAAHGDGAAGGCEGGDGQRRGHAADRRFRRLPRAPVAVHLPLQPDHEAGVRRREARAEARRLRRGRGGARAARGPGRRGRGTGEARADRPSRGHRGAHREVRTAPARRHGLRARQHQQRLRATRPAGSSTTS